MPSPPPPAENDEVPIVRLALMEERLRTVEQDVNRNHDATKEMKAELNAKLDLIGNKLETTYATKSALELVDKKVTSMQAYVSWSLKAIATAIVTGIGGWLFAHGGVPHP